MSKNNPPGKTTTAPAAAGQPTYLQTLCDQFLSTFLQDFEFRGTQLETLKHKHPDKYRDLLLWYMPVRKATPGGTFTSCYIVSDNHFLFVTVILRTGAVYHYQLFLDEDEEKNRLSEEMIETFLDIQELIDI